MNYPEVLRNLPIRPTARSQSCSYKRRPRSQDNSADAVSSPHGDEPRTRQLARVGFIMKAQPACQSREPDITKQPAKFRSQPFRRLAAGTKITLVKPAVIPVSTLAHKPMRELKRDTSPLSMVYLPLDKRIREKVIERDLARSRPRKRILPTDSAANGLLVLDLANGVAAFGRRRG
jgi:hypothetical protein